MHGFAFLFFHRPVLAGTLQYAVTVVSYYVTKRMFDRTSLIKLVVYYCVALILVIIAIAYASLDYSGAVLSH